MLVAKVRHAMLRQHIARVPNVGTRFIIPSIYGDTDVYGTAVPLKYKKNSPQNIRGYTDTVYISVQQ